jgi:hypothetical protein
MIKTDLNPQIVLKAQHSLHVLSVSNPYLFNVIYQLLLQQQSDNQTSSKHPNGYSK